MNDSDQYDAAPAPPQNINAEQALLGAIFLSNPIYGRVAEFLKPDHFCEALHGVIFETAGKMIVEGRPCTPISIRSQIVNADLGEIDVATYLARLASSATTTVNALEYARTVHELAQRRSLITIADQLRRRAFEETIDAPPAVIIEETAQELAVLGRQGSGRAKDAESIGVVAASVVERAQQIRLSQITDDKIDVGIPSLDRVIGGLGRQNFCVIAGRPGMGKTALATQIAFNISRAGPVLYFSLEMERDEITERLLANVAYEPGIETLTYQEIRRPLDLTESQMKRLVYAERELRASGIIIEDAGGLTAEQIGFRTRMHVSRLALQGKTLSATVVDHLGLISVPQIKNNPVAAMTYVTGSMKGLAKATSVPVIALSQLSRAVEARDDKKPQLADLRESGSIEQDADVVISVYREDYYVQKGMWRPTKDKDGNEKAPAPVWELEARVLKNRHGKEGPALLWCDMAHNIIAERAR